MLLRFWLRVDRVLVRLYETRYMADFRAGPGQPQVTREVRCCEGTFNALHAAGAPPDGVSQFTSVILWNARPQMSSKLGNLAHDTQGRDA